MGSVNSVTLIGNLCADVELKHTPAGKAVANLRIATNEVWKDKEGNKQEKAEFHRVTAWDQLAENCGKYLSKGRQVYVEGRLETRTYDKDGQKHYSTEITARQVVFLGGGGGDGKGENKSNAGTETKSRSTPASDDDIPF